MLHVAGVIDGNKTRIQLMVNVDKIVSHDIAVKYMGNPIPLSFTDVTQVTKEDSILSIVNEEYDRRYEKGM